MQKVTAATPYEFISRETLPDCATHWDISTTEEVEEFEAVLNSAKDERTMQAFLAMHRHLLAETMGGGHGRWVIPQKRLGSEHIPDFLIGEKHSFGHEWVAVELESPTEKAFNKNGDPSKMLNHAMRQIHDWRQWLKENLDYARKPAEDKGLGLIGIQPSLDALVIIGRRAEYDPSTKGIRQQIKETSRIEIRSYEYLVDTARVKAEHFKR